MTTLLDPLTENRIEEAFSERCVVSARQVARIVGIDYARVLEDIEAGRLQGAVYGKVMSFNANNIRAYLGRVEECPSTGQKEPTSTSTTSRSRAKGTTARPAKSKSPQPSGWSERRAQKLRLASDRTRQAK